MNNLLERLHASFFFYVLTTPFTFVNFGGYLASALLVSITMILGGLRVWTIAGWHYGMAVEPEEPSSDTKKATWPRAIPVTTWRRRRRPVLSVLMLMFETHAFGWMIFHLMTTTLYGSLLKVGSALACSRWMLTWFLSVQTSRGTHNSIRCRHGLPFSRL